MPARRRTALAVVIALSLAALSACGSSGDHSAAASSGGGSGSAPAAPGGFVPAPIEWRTCGTTDCATIDVPLDYANPTGEKISLDLDRLRARDPAKRIGALLVNPGGPGASGVDFIKGGVAFASDVQDRFDIIGFDPRGVGGSDELPCGDSTVDAFRAIDVNPDTPQETQELDDAAKAVADDCARHAGTLLPHIGTADVVRDMDTIRAALGEDKISYAGFSYGTLLGLRYLAEFPEHARAVYLDGVVDPTQDFVAFLTAQTTAFEKRLQQIFDDCPAGKDGCPDGGAQAAYDKISQRVETDPLPAGKDKLGPTALSTAAIYTAYSSSTPPSFYRALQHGLDGDGTQLKRLADGYDLEGHFTTYAGVECIDSKHPVGAAAYTAFAADMAKISPRLGAAIANELLPCAFWDAPVNDVVGEVTAPNGPPTLVVGTTDDSATPYENAVAVAGMLTNARLVTYESSGHTTYGASRCVADLVATYLVSLELPDEGTTCRT